MQNNERMEKRMQPNEKKNTTYQRTNGSQSLNDRLILIRGEHDIASKRGQGARLGVVKFAGIVGAKVGDVRVSPLGGQAT